MAAIDHLSCEFLDVDIYVSNIYLIMCTYRLHKYILKVMLIQLSILGGIIFVKYLNLNKLLDMGCFRYDFQMTK